MSSLRPVVIKIGTSSLTQPETGRLALATIGALVETLTALRDRGYPVVLVSSGAGGVGVVGGRWGGLLSIGAGGTTDGDGPEAGDRRCRSRAIDAHLR